MIKKIFTGIFFLSLIFHVCISAIGFTYPLTDVHGIRQTQTAIVSYYFLKDGYQFDYQIPIFGSPWSITLEFPIFQGIVAMIVSLLHTPLDETGRFVSLCFFYLSLGVLLLIVRLFPRLRDFYPLFGILFLLNPLYLFWSRTFMVESTALFFSLAFLYGCVRYVQNHSPLYIVLGIVAGSLAGLTKITTFLLFLFISAGIMCQYFFPKIGTLLRGKHWNAVMNCTIATGLIFAVPLIVSGIWYLHAGEVRKQNPLEHFGIVPMSWNDWNYGTIQQKLSWVTWIQMTDHITLVTGHWLFLLLPLLGIIFAKRYRMSILLPLLGFFLGPVIFTNLYLIHDYYYYANTVFFTVSVGITFCWMFHHRYLKYPAILCVLLLCGTFLYTYFSVYYPKQSTNDVSFVEIANQVALFTKEEDVLMYYGYFWDPQIPYYSGRRAIIDIWNRPVSDSKIQESINNTGKEKIAGMMVKLYDPTATAARIEYFGLDPTPVFKHRWGELYVRGKNLP